MDAIHNRTVETGVGILAEGKVDQLEKRPMSNNILKNIDTLAVHASRSLQAELSQDDIPLEARIERADTWWRVLQIARFLKDDATAQRRSPMMETVKFIRNGETITARVLDRDSDPTAALWVIDTKNPDRDFIVSPSELIQE